MRLPDRDLRLAMALGCGAAAALATQVAAPAVPALAAVAVALAATAGGALGLAVGLVLAAVMPVAVPLRAALALVALVAVERRLRDERRMRQLADASLTDRLTGLKTYAVFRDALAREVERVRRYGGSCTLLVLDLDHFKQFNDRYGHASGNLVLEAAGAVVRRAMRGSELAARFGGEEIVILLPRPLDEGIALAERIRARIAEVAVVTPEGMAGTTVSIGVAEIDEITRTAADLFMAADAMLYEAKARGRDLVVAAGPADPASIRLAG